MAILDGPNKLYDMILPQEESELSDLRLIRTSGKVDVCDGNLTVDSGGSVSFDTYFNCFPYSKFLTYTNVSLLTLRLNIKGCFSVRLVERQLTKPAKEFSFEQKKFKKADSADTDKTEEETKPGEDAEFCDVELISRECRSDGFEPIDLSLHLESTEGEGELYAVVTAGEGGCKIQSGAYLTDAESTQAFKCGIVICTYMREEYVKRNLKCIGDYLKSSEDINGKYEVFVVDNGNTLKRGDLECEYAHLFPNRNLGGSGGFTRGIIEVSSRPEFTHFLLMDDDVSFRPRILQRIASIAEHAKLPDALAVGGCMLRADRPYVQYENGAQWRGTYLTPNSHNFDLSSANALIANEHELPIDYNAWWCMCMPVAAVKRCGLPLPLFIKCDDVEYGMRACPQIAVMNGIGLEHESFENKYSAELEYYIKRNELIVAALHSEDVGAAKQIVKLLRSVGRQLVYQRYVEADFIFRGYADFFKGPAYLANLNGEDLHAELRARKPKLFTREELQAKGYDCSDFYSAPPKRHRFIRQVLSLNGYLLPSFFYDKTERLHGRTVDVTRASPKDFYKSPLTIQFNEQTGRGFVTKQKRSEVLKAGLKLCVLIPRLLFGYAHARKKWREGLSVLTSAENWKKLLKI